MTNHHRARGSEPPPVRSSGAGIFMKGVLLLFGVIAVALLFKGNQPEGDSTTRPSGGSGSSPSGSSGGTPWEKADAILAQQKARAQEIDRQAVELITQDKMAEARKVYKARWNELAKLRLAVIQDETLTPYDRKRVDGALKADQEGVTAVLSKYDELYGEK